MFIPFKVMVNVFWVVYPYSISSLSVSRTFKAHNDTLFEVHRSFENGRNFMYTKISIMF